MSMTAGSMTSAGKVGVMVVLEGCGELIVDSVTEEDSGDPDKIRLVIEAIKPGA